MGTKIEKTFKTAEDFGGYWISGLKEYKGHEGEPLFQCNITKDGKKIGMFATADWGGEATYGFNSDKAEKEIETFIKSFFPPEKLWCSVGEGSPYPLYCTLEMFLIKILEEKDSVKWYRRHCSKKTLVRTADQEVGSHYEYKYNYKTNKAGLLKHFDKKYGAGNYIVINEELASL